MSLFSDPELVGIFVISAVLVCAMIFATVIDKREQRKNNKKDITAFDVIHALQRKQKSGKK